MCGIRLVRPIATRALAFTVLLATYGCGTLAVTGIVSTVDASTAFAKSGFSSQRSSSRMVGSPLRSSGNWSNYRSFGPRYVAGNQMSNANRISRVSGKRSATPPTANPQKTNRTLSAPNWTSPATSAGSSASTGDFRSVNASVGRGLADDSERIGSNVGRSASARAIEACAQRYRSYDRDTMTYTDTDGRRRSCP